MQECTINIYNIYKITSPSGKVYIGQSKDLKKRFRSYKNCKPSQKVIKRSISKYGYENHIFEVLLTGLTKLEANEHEIALIRHYKEQDISLNISNGGYTDIDAVKKRIVKLTLNGEFVAEYDSIEDGAKSVDADSRVIFSAIKRKGSSRGYLWDYWKNYTTNYRVEWRQRGCVINEEASIYIFDFGNYLLKTCSSLKDACNFTGIETSRIKRALGGITYSIKGLRFSHTENITPYKPINSKAIIQYDLNNNFIQEFSSTREACLKLGISKSTVINKLKADHKVKPQYLFTFKYKNE